MKRFRWIILGIVVIIVLVVAGVIYAARSSSTVNAPHTAPGVAKNVCATPAATNGLQIFKVVPAQSTVSYSVYENLIIQNKPNNDAIGKTNSIEGQFNVKTGASPSVTGMNITVDLRTLKTDSERRDGYVQKYALETNLYPTTTFVSTCAQGLPATYTDGQPVHFQLVGNMTLHGKTNQETFDVQGKVSGQTITGVATVTIYMTDFGIQPPNLANIAVSENKVVVTVDFTANNG